MDKSFHFTVMCRFSNDSRYFTKESFDLLEDAKVFADALSVCTTYAEVVVVRHDVEPVYNPKDYARE